MSASEDIAPPPDYPHPHGRRNIVARAWRILTSPSAAFLFLFPTIGYYSLATYTNLLFGDEDSTGGIIIRASSLCILIVAYFGVHRKDRRSLSAYLLPATVFIAIYSFRLTENIFLLEFNIPPGNVLIISIFFLSGLLPAYLLSFLHRVIRDKDMIQGATLFSFVFLIGMALNWESIVDTADVRLYLEKINPISIAYVASSLLLFYMLTFIRSPYLLSAAIVFVPFLLVITSLARSRGMLIATGITILIYVLTLNGARRICTILGLMIVALVVAICGNDYVGHSIQALQRINSEIDQSTWERTVYFRGAWDQFTADPFWGRYVNEQVLNGPPHNIYLESLMAVGIVGTLPLFIHVMLAWRAALGLLRHRHASFVNLFVALLYIRESIGVAASGALWSVSGFWITSFLVIVMWYGRDRRWISASAVEGK